MADCGWTPHFSRRFGLFLLQKLTARARGLVHKAQSVIHATFSPLLAPSVSLALYGSPGVSPPQMMQYTGELRVLVGQPFERMLETALCFRRARVNLDFLWPTVILMKGTQ